MSAGSHEHEDHASGARASNLRLAWVLALTVGYTLAEIVGGFLANSLALLADAGHMLTDVLALSLALFAAWISRRPADPERTYGYQRAEILAALVNGVALVVICIFIFWESIGRLRAPQAVDVGLMSWIAAGGLVVNLAGAFLLRGGRGGLNERAAFLHIVGDLLGSVGALTAAAAIAIFGWTGADAVAGLVIGGIIIWSATRLALASLHVLMEGAPSHIDIEAVQSCLLGIEGVSGVHDLHVWSLAGGSPLLTAHVVVDHSIPAYRVLRAASAALERRFGIIHATIQIEPPDYNIRADLTSRDG
jgi:cobalt-zinc-cadmium efflux system protein